MNNMKVENWCGYDIRFIEIDGEWWAILKDICDALRLRTDGTAQRLHPDTLRRVLVEAPNSTTVQMGLNRKRGQWKTHWMLMEKLYWRKS